MHTQTQTSMHTPRHTPTHAYIKHSHVNIPTYIQMIICNHASRFTHTHAPNYNNIINTFIITNKKITMIVLQIVIIILILLLLLINLININITTRNNNINDNNKCKILTYKRSHKNYHKKCADTRIHTQTRSHTLIL